jgi:hypothetical protein
VQATAVGELAWLDLPLGIICPLAFRHFVSVRGMLVSRFGTLAWDPAHFKPTWHFAARALLQCLVNGVSLNKSSFAGPQESGKARGNVSLANQTVTDCVAPLEAFERAGTPRHVDGRLNGGKCA